MHKRSGRIIGLDFVHHDLIEKLSCLRQPLAVGLNAQVNPAVYTRVHLKLGELDGLSELFAGFTCV